MQHLELIIGNKNYSSWSMRPWIFMRECSVEFSETKIQLFTPEMYEKLEKYGSNYKVPVLQDNNLIIWDSLAIMEYINDTYLNGAGLPLENTAKALCRSVCSEMHSSFFALRNEMGMNIRATKNIIPSDECKSDIKRIDELWQLCRSRYSESGEYLFGRYSMADAMFAPVVMRFMTYGVVLSEVSTKYMQTVLRNVSVQEWMKDAQNETEILSDYE